MNKWEEACKEFLKGCSCSSIDHQEECTECLTAFCNHLRKLAKEEGGGEHKRNDIEKFKLFDKFMGGRQPFGH